MVNLTSIYENLSAIISDRLEILLVNNGSTDATDRLCRDFAASNRQVKCINLQSRGRGRALREGFCAAQGEFVAVGAIDRAWNEKFYSEALKTLSVQSFDVIFGPKTHTLSRVQRPWFREFCSSISRIGLKFLFQELCHDTQCIKMFRKSRILFLSELGNYNYFSDTEFFLRCLSGNLRLGFLPVEVRDNCRESKVKFSSYLEYMREAHSFYCDYWRERSCPLPNQTDLAVVSASSSISSAFSLDSENRVAEDRNIQLS